MRTLLLIAMAFVAGYGTALATMTQPIDRPVQVAVQRPVSEAVATNAHSSGREVLLADARGHVETIADIDGREMEVLVDTGASAVVLRESDARRAGHRPHHSEFTVPVNTANGQAFLAPIVLRSVELGSIRVRNVRALVARDEDLSSNLLGMSFLSQLDGFRFEGQELILED
ncbi:MAG: TIGR02281 family clan AA aspartic protease [Hyphomicrobiales bacterium]